MNYSVGVTGELVVFPEQPQWIRPAGPSRGRPRTRPRLAPNNPRPVPLSALAARVLGRRATRREGTKRKRSGRFAGVRVWPGHGGATGACVDAKPVWPLLEKQADGPLTFAVSIGPRARVVSPRCGWGGAAGRWRKGVSS